MAHLSTTAGLPATHCNSTLTYMAVSTAYLFEFALFPLQVTHTDENGLEATSPIGLGSKSVTSSKAAVLPLHAQVAPAIVMLVTLLLYYAVALLSGHVAALAWCLLCSSCCCCCCCCCCLPCQVFMHAHFASFVRRYMSLLRCQLSRQC